MDLPVQTRDEEGSLRYFATIEDALAYARKEPSVWKISFDSVTGERVRLVIGEYCEWMYEPILGD